MEASHKHHLFTLLHHFSTLVSFLFSLSIATFIFFSKCHPIYHIIPLSITFSTLYLFSSHSQIYLVDFSCLKPPKNLRVPISLFIEQLSLIGCFDKESISFMTKLINSSGMGQETYLPSSLHLLPTPCTHQDAINEAHMLSFPTLDQLFQKTKVSPCEIDLIVTNCSGFCPSPSLSAIIVNKYKMRGDVKSYNISGMGCGAGVIGIDIAKGFLQTCRKKSNALVVSTEILSVGWYNGKDHRKLMLNCFFRTGCSAVLLTNRVTNDNKSKLKFRLAHLLRTQQAYDDRAHHAASRVEDEEGITGFSIEREILEVISNLIRSHLVSLGPIILPWQEKIRYVMSHFFDKNVHYVPDFAKAAKHFCVPSSSKPMIKRIAKGLCLHEEMLESVFATFHRFGNQSSSSMWYQLAYLEAKAGKVSKGDRIWQLGWGTGPKCNSVIWEALREFEGEGDDGPWSDCVHRYPVLD